MARKKFKSFGDIKRSEIELFKIIVDSVRMRIMGLKLKGTGDISKASEIWSFLIDKRLKYSSMRKDMDSDYMVIDGEPSFCADGV